MLGCLLFSRHNPKSFIGNLKSFLIFLLFSVSRSLIFKSRIFLRYNRLIIFFVIDGRLVFFVSFYWGYCDLRRLSFVDNFHWVVTGSPDYSLLLTHISILNLHFPWVILSRNGRACCIFLQNGPFFVLTFAILGGLLFLPSFDNLLFLFSCFLTFLGLLCEFLCLDLVFFPLSFLLFPLILHLLFHLFFSFFLSLFFFQSDLFLFFLSFFLFFAMLLGYLGSFLILLFRYFL